MLKEKDIYIFDGKIVIDTNQPLKDKEELIATIKSLKKIRGLRNTVDDSLVLAVLEKNDLISRRSVMTEKIKMTTDYEMGAKVQKVSLLREFKRKLDSVIGK